MSQQPSAENDAAFSTVRDALDESLTPSLPNAHWACDPLPSCPHYAHVNPDWLRALIAEALRVREVVARVIPPGVDRAEKTRDGYSLAVTADPPPDLPHFYRDPPRP